MEKLLKNLIKYSDKHLPNIYEWYLKNGVIMCKNKTDGFIYHVDVAESIIISKNFYFIKWLVDNDKINRPKFFDAVSDYCEDLVPYPANETLLMLLSISDTPINDLISYLK